MKRHLNHRTTRRTLLCGLLAGSLVMPLPSTSAPLTLATVPLASATTTKVLPNLMFIIDSSGSMGRNYSPDWATDNYCRNDDSVYDRDCTNQPPFQSPDFNGMYYNPAVTYLPAVNADGSSKPNQTSWTAVKNDAYDSSSSSTNLVTGYVDVEWCTSSSSYTDCLRNDNYILPGIVNGKSYIYAHTTTSSGSGSVATGPVSSPTTQARTWGPHYYMINAGEWCDSLRLKNCQTTKAAPYIYPAKLRWCTNAAMTDCQAFRTSTYTVARYPTMVSPATATITVTGGSSTTSVSSVKVNGQEILSGTTSGASGNSSVASNIRDAINNCTAAKTGKCTVAGYKASTSNGVVTVYAPISAGAITDTPVVTKTFGSKTITSTAFANFQLVPGSFERVDIVSSTSSYPYPGAATKAASRSDCAGSTCTYAEEMTNFANWWTYYQTRMQTMKTAVSRSFKQIDNRYRVGFIDIYGGNYLPIAKFDAGPGSVKETWYTKLFSVKPTNGTPLRSALSRVGLIFAGKKPVGSADPVEYSCQQNFALLTTDGYWNTDSDSSAKGIDGSSVGNMDGGSTPRPMYEGPTTAANTLADVAKYYNDTDIRNSTFGNCTGALGLDVCENNVFVSNSDNNVKQHMTTFTLGLGVDGTLAYTNDYKTATSGDYFNIVNGSGSPMNWPVPAADSETAVDDLWHAAVNGGGVYFSAKDPVQLSSGLNSALSGIGAKLGAGAAAATSTLNPVAGDNFAYVASYTTVKWQGNLEARTINDVTGVVSETATWCVENVVAGSCPAPGSVVADTSGGSTIYNCVTPGSTASTCGGVLEGSNCKVELPVACTGTMASSVAPNSDKRTIWASNGSGTKVDFKYDNLTSTQKGYFSGTSLSQWTLFDSAQQADAAGANLVNFLRGQTGYEDRGSNDVAKRLFRYREATLGDPLESQPVHVGKPARAYADSGYSSFVTENSGRPKTVYIGTNDGMLHAFNADNGQERWAFIPNIVMPNLWKLADKNYATMHTNYVNGKPVVGDAYVGGSWRTLLIAGLNGGGRGYFALDVTDPEKPELLWEIDANTTTDSALQNIGYTYGPPIITKRENGTWVVVVSSGYNNISPGDGRGYLFMLDPMTGARVGMISTGAGDTTTPSGLSRLSGWGDDPMKDNTARYVYGGDLQGNLWRFDLTAGSVMKFATLKDSSGNPQPITSTPELGQIDKDRVVMVATGKYLEISDLTNTQRQSVYTIKDANATTPLENARTALVPQTITASGATRNATETKVDFKTGRGWYADFPDTGERNHVDPLLDSGLLFVPTTVPSNTVCAPGGYGWLNYFDYKTGTNPASNSTIVSQKYNGSIVGINVFYTKDGKRHVAAVTASNPTPEKPPIDPPPPTGDKGFAGHRLIWRELLPH